MALYELSIDRAHVQEGERLASLEGRGYPTLVMQCSTDVIAPVEVGSYVHEAIPESTLAMLSATGHVPILSDPDEVVRAIRRFVT